MAYQELEVLHRRVHRKNKKKVSLLEFLKGSYKELTFEIMFSEKQIVLKNGQILFNHAFLMEKMHFYRYRFSKASTLRKDLRRLKKEIKNCKKFIHRWYKLKTF